MKKIMILLLCATSLQTKSMENDDMPESPCSHQPVGVLGHTLVSRIEEYEQQQTAGGQRRRSRGCNTAHEMNREQIGRPKKPTDQQTNGNSNYLYPVAGGLMAFVAYGIYNCLK